MHPILERVAHAYAPLAGRNRLVEGAPAPPVSARPPQRRLTLVAWLAILAGRRA